MGCPRPNTPRSDATSLGELEKPLRDRLWSAFQASPRRRAGGGYGLALVSGFRDPGRQWDLRHDRVPHGQECNPRVRAYPATAVPYASQHQKRKAADVGGVDLGWLVANCARFGLKRTVASERWHYEAIGTPQVPIITYPGRAYDNAGPIARPIPQPIKPPAPIKETFLMALTDAQQDELYRMVKRIDQNAESAVKEARSATGALSRLGTVAKEARIYAARGYAYAKTGSVHDLDAKEQAEIRAEAAKIDPTNKP